MEVVYGHGDVSLSVQHVTECRNVISCYSRLSMALWAYVIICSRSRFSDI
jgi:hypothetical protein